MKPRDMPVKRPHLWDIRTKNRSALLRLMQKGAVISRRDMVEQTGLTHTAVSRLIKDLIAEGICYEDQSYHGDTKLGRRRVELRVNPDGGYLIAICLSAFSRALAIVDITGQKRHCIEIPEENVRSAKAAMEFIESCIHDLRKSGKLKQEKLLGASLAIAGSINSETGHLIRAPLLNWHDFPIREHLADRLSCAVRVENVADALCWTCLDQMAVKKSTGLNLFLVHVAAGMGASLAIDNRVVRRRDDEGWIGNVPTQTVLDPTGKIQRLNQTSSGYAILHQIEQAAARTATGDGDFATRLNSAVHAANRKNGIERQVFFEAGQALGASLLSLTAAYLPDSIILAGPAVAASSFFDGVTAGYARAANGMDAESVEISINRTSYLDASKNIALQEYFYSGALRSGPQIEKRSDA